MVRVIDIPEQLAADGTGEVAIEIFEEAVRAAALEDEDAKALFEWTALPPGPTYWEGGSVELVGTTIHVKAPKQVSVPTSKTFTKAPNRGRGRPSSLKRIAVKALIYHTYLDRSWAELAKQFCTTPEARRSLKPKVTQLRGQLRKYGVLFDRGR